ncbi:MAG: MarR family transcriptional regulator [Paracoccaceae bacterium]|nr:MAG: MarR family transcriptional regulator [Paracoccaceae bacterium]
MTARKSRGNSGSGQAAADQIAAGLARLGAYMRMAGWQAAHAQGLTATQAEILGHLARRGPMRAGELAAALGVTPATLSDSAAALVAKGLAARRRDPGDGRAVRLSLTAAGGRVAQALAGPPGALSAALAALDPRQAGALLRGLATVIRSLQQARAMPVQRMCVTCRFFRPHVHDDADAPHHCDFVNAAFGDAALRIDCGEHEPAPAAEAAARWQRFDSAGADRPGAPSAATDGTPFPSTAPGRTGDSRP